MEYGITTRENLRTEVDYRLNRAKSDLAGRRRRRGLPRAGADGLTWTKIR